MTDFTLLYVALLGMLILAAAVWAWFVLANPRDYMALQRNLDSDTAFNQVALIRLKGIQEKFKHQREAVINEGEALYPIESLDLGTSLSEIGRSLIIEELLIERYSGWMLNHISIRLRRPAVAFLAMRYITELLGELIDGIESKNVKLCYRSLTRILFTSSYDDERIPADSERLEPFRQQFAVELKRMSGSLFEQQSESDFPGFLIKWSPIIVKVGDADIYSFLLIMNSFKEWLFIFLPEPPSKEELLINSDTKKWFLQFARGLSENDEIARYDASARLVGMILKHASNRRLDMKRPLSEFSTRTPEISTQYQA